MNNINSTIYKAELRKFYYDSYTTATGYKKIKNKEVLKFVEKNILLDNSNVRRITLNIQRLKYMYLTPKTEYIATCIKVSYKNTSCGIGFLYSRYNKNVPGNIENTYVSFGGSFRSQDGEYRRRMHTWDNFVKIYDKYKQYFERIELFVLNKMATEQITFHTDFCFPMDFTHSEKLMSNMLDTTRVFVKMFVMCLFADYMRIEDKLIENHINPAYQYVIHQRDFDSIYRELLNELTRIGYITILYVIDKIGAVDIPAIPPYLMGECGQKIIPITIFEAIKNDDITMSVWREIYLTNLCSNLVLNLISPSFAFNINWFYVQNSHPGIFDNLSMHDKYRFSDIAKQIAAGLREVSKLNYIDGDQRRGPIDGKFIKLAKIIQNANRYVDTSLKLTDLSVCMLTEYVDRTLRDLPMFASIDKRIMLFFTDIHHLHKHIFEYMYAFYNMNSKVGIFHGDLHLNNATFHKFINFKTDPNTNYGIMYNIESSYYVFPHSGAFSTIIDFSRAIIGNRERIVHDFGEAAAAEYFKIQRDRVMQILYHYFPTIIEKHRATIDVLLIDKFELIFKILTAIDTYTLTSNISAMFVIDPIFKDGQIVVPPEITKFLIRITQLAETTIVNNLRGAIDGKITKASDIDWPNYTMIKALFDDYLYQNYIKSDTKITICDYFSSENEMIYDISDMTNWGPLLSLDKQLQLAKKYGLSTAEYEKTMVEMERDETEKIEYLTSQYRREEKDLTKIESWMLV